MFIPLSILAATGNDLEADIWQKLVRFQWCTPQAPGPGKVYEPYYFPAEDRLYAPREMRPAEDALLVSGACALLDGKASEALKAKLDWEKPPSVRLLKAQLLWLQAEVGFFLPLSDTSLLVFDTECEIACIPVVHIKVKFMATMQGNCFLFKTSKAFLNNATLKHGIPKKGFVATLAAESCSSQTLEIHSHGVILQFARYF